MNSDHLQELNHAQLAAELLDSVPVLSAKIESACPVSQADVLRLLTEVIRFLDLIATHENVLSPSQLVDLAWHELILCTKVYGDFCQQHFGRMIHHHPGGTDADNLAQYRMTLQWYRQHFGEPSREFWGVSPELACGGCESS